MAQSQQKLEGFVLFCGWYKQFSCNPRRHPTNIDRPRENKQKSQRFVKLKEVQANAPSPPTNLQEDKGNFETTLLQTSHLKIVNLRLIIT